MFIVQNRHIGRASYYGVEENHVRNRLKIDSEGTPSVSAQKNT